MAGGMDFYTEDLRAAAQDALAIADGIGLAKEASAAALPGNAFGIMCSPLFLPLYTIVQTASDLMMSSAGDSIERAGSQLKQIADEFEAMDAASGATFDGMGGI